MLIAKFIVYKLINKVLVLKMHISLFALHFLFEPRRSKSKAAICRQFRTLVASSKESDLEGQWYVQKSFMIHTVYAVIINEYMRLF